MICRLVFNLTCNCFQSKLFVVRTKIRMTGLSRAAWQAVWQAVYFQSHNNHGQGQDGRGPCYSLFEWECCPPLAPPPPPSPPPSPSVFWLALPSASLGGAIPIAQFTNATTQQVCSRNCTTKKDMALVPPAGRDDEQCADASYLATDIPSERLPSGMRRVRKKHVQVDGVVITSCTD